VYFYELHESDDDLFSDALLAHPQEFSETEFFDLVMEARARVIQSFEEDNLVAAIAHALERGHGFLYVDERRLSAAVNVSLVEADNVIAAAEGGRAPNGGDEGWGADDDDDEDAAEGEGDEDLDEDFRTIVVKVDRADFN
jgi:hypothetical protein